MALALLILGGLLVRVAACFWLDAPAFSSDSDFYLGQAQAIRSGTWTNFFPNGYPLLLAVLPPYAAPPSIVAAQVVNIACGVATIWLTHATAVRMGCTARVAHLAAALVAFWPHQVNYVRFLLTETTVTAAVAAAVWAAVARRPVAAGFAMGVGTVIRTTLAPSVFLIPIVGGRAAGWRFAAAMSAVGLVPIALVMLAALPSGHSGLGANLPQNIEIARLSDNGVYRWDAPVYPLRESLAHYTDDAMRDPARFLRQRLQAISEMWGPYPPEASRGPIRRLVIGLHFPALLLAVVGFWSLRHHPWRWAVVLPMVTTTAIHAALFANARFSVPFEPQVLLLAAVGVDALGSMRPSDGRSNA